MLVLYSTPDGLVIDCKCSKMGFNMQQQGDVFFLQLVIFILVSLHSGYIQCGDVSFSRVVFDDIDIMAPIEQDRMPYKIQSQALQVSLARWRY